MKKANRIPDMLIRLRLLTTALALCFLGAALANPVNPTVIAGQAGFNSASNTLTVTNTPSAIINWQGFSIGPNEVTRFIQQSAASAVLNRVTGADPSQILGALQSNGRVFLINPNGIAFGAGSRIDVGGLVASTLNLSDADFLTGRMNFTERAGTGAITNAGEIRAAAGSQVLLIAPKVENAGLIEAPNGDILLAAGRSVRLVDVHNPEIQYEVNAPDNAVVNIGNLSAVLVGLYGGAVRHAGTVSANSVETDAAGRIVFRALREATIEKGSRTEASGRDGGTVSVRALGGDAVVAGMIETVGREGSGGHVEVLGNRVAVAEQAVIDASGGRGGGRILVGGDYQGGNVAVQNAKVTYFGSEATLRADASDKGNGGSVIVWADDTTRAYGKIAARGGANGGDGGFVEASGRHHLDFQADVTTQAPMGATGRLLLDPTNVYIASNQVNATAAGMVGTDISVDASGPVLFQTGGTPTDSLLTVGNLQSALASNAVTVSTTSGGAGSGNIFVVDPVSWTAANDLTLSANNNIFLDAALSGNNAGIVLSGIGLSQAPGALITADRLKIAASGAVSLSEANMVNTLAASMAFGTGGLTYWNGKALTIGTVGGTNGIAYSDNVNPIVVKTTAGSLTVAQPVTADVLGGAQITLSAAAALAVDAPVTSTFNATPAGPVILEAGSGGVTGNASGVITAGGLKVISGGAITLNGAAHAIDILAGSSSGSFQFADANGFTVGTVAGTNGLTASSGDIFLTAGGSNSLLTVGLPVQASAGSVTYVADNQDHAAATTSSGVAGKFIEVKPNTAATQIEFDAAADATGFLRLSPAELGQFTTPLLKVGNSVVTGNITVNTAISPANFPALSLITSGSILQTTGSTITIAELNADGHAGVSLTEANNVVKLGGHTNAGAFTFADTDGFDIALVDVNNGISSSGGGNIVLTSQFANITQSGGATLATSGAATINAQTGITLNSANTAPIVSLNNSVSGHVGYSANTVSLSASAANSATGGNLTLSNTGSVVTTGSGIGSNGTTTVNASGGGSDITVTTWAPIMGNDVTLNAGRDVLVNGSEVYANVVGGNVNITAGRDIRVAAAAGYDAAINAGGDIFLTATTGKLYLASSGANSARVESALLLTVHLNVPGVLSGGYVIDGVEGSSPPISGVNSNTGIFTNSTPAVLGATFLVTTGAPPLPSLADCIANPMLVGCSSVLPSLATCTAAPTTPGCEVVLPSLAICTAVPTTPGCSVVLPSLSTCTSAPTTPGCSAVLPSLAACVAAPVTPGCEAVLPPGSTTTLIAQLTRDIDPSTGLQQIDQQGDALEEKSRKKKNQDAGKGSTSPQDIRSLKDLPECRP